MERTTLLQSNYFPYRIFTLGEALDNYGIDFVADMSGVSFIFYEPRPPNSSYKAALKRGRPCHHINKTNGGIKKKFKKGRISDHIYYEAQSLERFPNAKILNSIQIISYYFKKHYSKRSNNAVIIQKYIRRFLVDKAIKNAKYLISENVDFITDPISCDEINEPVIIYKDWEQNCKQIFDFSTLVNCKYVTRIPVYFYEDSTGQTVYVEREVIKTDGFGNAVFKSPHTRIEFTCDDMVFLEQKLWYKIGCLLQNKKQ